MDYLELVSHLLLKPSSTDCFRPTRLLSPCTQPVLTGCVGEHWSQDKLSPTETCENSPSVPSEIGGVSKANFSNNINHFAESSLWLLCSFQIRLSPPFPLFLAIQHPHGSLNKVTLHCFPKSLALDKVRCLSCSALSLPDTSLMNNIGRRRVLNLGSRHSLWLMPLIHSTWLMNAFPNINTCHHLWEFKNPHRGSNHTLAYQCLKFLSSKTNVLSSTLITLS